MFCREKLKMTKISRVSLAVMLGAGMITPVIAAEPVGTASTTPVPQPDNTQDSSETLLVTAQQQTLRALGVSTITAEEIKNGRLHAISQRSFAPCGRQSHR